VRLAGRGNACVVGRHAALQSKSIPSRKEGPFNLLMRRLHSWISRIGVDIHEMLNIGAA
jgi:hypothetical protein